MTSTVQELADAANDSYANRLKIDIDKETPILPRCRSEAAIHRA